MTQKMFSAETTSLNGIPLEEQKNHQAGNQAVEPMPTDAPDQLPPERDTTSDCTELTTSGGESEATAEPDIRTALTIQEAAGILGRSVRAVERSLTGKWGNHLPGGWSARKFVVDGHEEWRIIPPPTFKIHKSLDRQETKEAAKAKTESLAEGAEMTLQAVLEPLELAAEQLTRHLAMERSPARKTTTVTGEDDRTTIVIDRSDEVEELLRQLSESQKSLAEEMRQHIEDLRLLNQLQGSMRLIEANNQETQKLKAELLEAQKEMLALKRQYHEFLQLSWWQRLFKRFP